MASRISHERWRKRASSGAMLRLVGLLLIVLATLGVWAVHALVVTASARPSTIAECVVAAAAFLAASFGSAMLAWGPRLLEPVELSERWRPRN